MRRRLRLRARAHGGRSHRRTRRAQPAQPRLLDSLSNAGRDLCREVRHRAWIVCSHHEGRDPIFERKPGELRGHLARRRFICSQVQEPPDRGWIAAGAGGRRVDDGVAGGEAAWFKPADGGQPAVAEPADQPQHPGLERADPDAYVVHRRWPAEGAGQPVVLTLEPHASPLTSGPQSADDVDAFLERLYTVANIEPPAAHCLDRFPGHARANTKLGASVAKNVEARDGSRQYGGWPHRQAQHVGRQVDTTGPRGHEGHQGQGVQSA
jgi:hypothetical protein